MPGLPVALVRSVVLPEPVPVYPAIVNPLAAVMGLEIVVVMAVASAVIRMPSLEPPKFSVPPEIGGANAAADDETSAPAPRVSVPPSGIVVTPVRQQERGDRQPGGADGRGVVLSLLHHVGGSKGRHPAARSLT